MSEEVWQAAELREQQVTMVGGRGTALLSGGVPALLPSDFVAIFPVFPPLHKEAQAGAVSGNDKTWDGFSAP